MATKAAMAAQTGALSNVNEPSEVTIDHNLVLAKLQYDLHASLALVLCLSLSCSDTPTKLTCSHIRMHTVLATICVPGL